MCIDCTEDQWRCNDGQCIPTDNRCDGRTEDCNDQSDEMQCELYSNFKKLYPLIKLNFCHLVILLNNKVS